MNITVLDEGRTSPILSLSLSLFLSLSVIAERLSVRYIIVGAAGAYGALVWDCACMYVWLSVMGLQLKYMSLRIVYEPSGTCHSWWA